MEVTLREVSDDDLPIFFAQTNDPEGIRMAAFTAADPADRTHFEAHWTRIRQDPAVITRTIVGTGGEIVGHAGAFGPPEEREVTYWIGREYWGRGAATAALRELLDAVPERPLHARAAADNLGSIQVLKKCGFLVTGTDRGFANARGEEIDEVLLVLHGHLNDPALTSAIQVGVADERATLAAFLDNYRAIIKAKVAGLSEADARRSTVPSGTSIGGLLKHLRWVELNWFQRVLAATPAADLPTPPWTDAEPDADFQLTDTETVADLIAAYDAQCALSREIGAAHALTDTGTHRALGVVSLRWIYLHMIEETARHSGQADILREQLDGVTGPEI